MSKKKKILPNKVENKKTVDIKLKDPIETKITVLNNFDLTPSNESVEIKTTNQLVKVEEEPVFIDQDKKPSKTIDIEEKLFEESLDEIFGPDLEETSNVDLDNVGFDEIASDDEEVEIPMISSEDELENPLFMEDDFLVDESEEILESSLKEKSTIVYTGIGKRKTSVAKIFLQEGSGIIRINNYSLEEFTSIVLKEYELVTTPFIITNLLSKYDTFIKVKGGGISSQLDAIILGISRALCNVNSSNRKILDSNFLLSRDSRKKERKKYGLKKARKASQYHKR